MQTYVCGFMFDEARRVALVVKDKPEAMHGLLNGIGGKVEPGEHLATAMIREFEEETGVRHEDWERFCSIQGENSLVHFYRAFVPFLPRFPTHNDVGERIVVKYGPRIAFKPGIVHHLRWLVPLALDYPDFKIVAPGVAE